MKHRSWLKAALAVSLTLTSIGCTNTARQAQIEAATRAGQAAAQVTMEKQPGECGRQWAPLTYAAGDEAVGIIRRYEAYIEGPINERAQRCYWFNENQRRGLTGGS